MPRSHHCRADGVVRKFRQQFVCNSSLPRPLHQRWLRAIFLVSRPPLLEEEGKVRTIPLVATGPIQAGTLSIYLGQVLSMTARTEGKNPLFASTTQGHSAECVNEYHDQQDQADNTDASAVPPSRISVIATASAEQEHQKNNQQ